MQVGNVVEEMVPLQQAACFQGQTIVLVESDGKQIAALDAIGAKAGQQVLLVTGPAAGRLCMQTPTDAAVVAILKEKC